MVKVHCGTCGRRLLDLKPTANGFRLQSRQGVKLTPVFEHGEVRFLTACWCPGKRMSPLPNHPEKLKEFGSRSYVLTERALLDAWDKRFPVVNLGDAVSAGRIR